MKTNNIKSLDDFKALDESSINEDEKAERMENLENTIKKAQAQIELDTVNMNDAEEPLKKKLMRCRIDVQKSLIAYTKFKINLVKFQENMRK